MKDTLIIAAYGLFSYTLGALAMYGHMMGYFD